MRHQWHPMIVRNLQDGTINIDMYIDAGLYNDFCRASSKAGTPGEEISVEIEQAMKDYIEKQTTEPAAGHSEPASGSLGYSELRYIVYEVYSKSDTDLQRALNDRRFAAYRPLHILADEDCAFRIIWERKDDVR